MTNSEETNHPQWIDVRPNSGKFEQDRRYNFTCPKRTVLRNLHLCFNMCTDDSDLFWRIRYDARWLLTFMCDGLIMAQVDSRINGEYLRQKDAEITAKYVQMFKALRHTHGDYEAEFALTDYIIKHCDADTQQMLRHCAELPRYYKVFLPRQFTIPVALDCTSPIDHMYGCEACISIDIISGFDAVDDFFVRMQTERTRTFDDFHHEYNRFASLRGHAVFSSGQEHFFADKCVYLFDDNDQQSHDNDVIRYATTNQPHPITKLLESRAKLIRPGVYRFDFIGKNCFYLNSNIACASSIIWRTISKLVFKDGALSVDNCYFVN